MSALSPQQDNAELRSDVRRLGELLGQSLARQDGEALLNLVELVRKSVREGSGEDLLNSISTADSVKLVRAFNVYFNLANVAEQVHRSRVLAQERINGGSWLTRAVDHILEAKKSGQSISDAEFK
jgi:phosphoenolpyruvate carboxylase